MARYTIERNFINVLGIMWMPRCNGATTINLSKYDLENIGEFTRENVELWLATHVGDFSEIVDFYATAGVVDIDWSDEENEMTFNDCMYPEEV